MESQTMFSHHIYDIMQRLNNDRKTSATYCDFTLIVDGHKYPVHKCIFLFSPFYDRMFNIEMKERFDNGAVIKGVNNKEVFEVILDFVYTGSITLNMNNVFGIIEAADYMDIWYVKECCTSYLTNNIKPCNWVNIKAYGERYGYAELLENQNKVLSMQFNMFIQSEHLVKLDISELKYLLSLENKNVESEEEIYKALIGWINYDVLNREKQIEELMSYVRFTEMSLDFLNQVVAKEVLIGISDVCTRNVVDATASLIKKRKILNPHDLQIHNFLAVEGKRVMKITAVGIEKFLLNHDHTHGSAAIGQYLFIVGGCNTSQIEVLHTKELKWAPTITSHSTERLRNAAASVTFRRKLYVCGGLGEESNSEVFDKRNSNVFQGSSFNEGNFERHGHALVRIASRLYVVGGSAELDRSLVLYEFSNNEMTTLPPMSTIRIGLAAVMFNREIYAIAGTVNNGCSLKTVEKYSPITKEWKTVASLNVERYRPGACVIDNQIVVVGGGNNVVEVYDQKNDVWKIVGKCEELKNVFAIFSC